jgi:alkylated DNA repair protein alkB homolog 8
METAHVYDVYNAIATHFDKTRYKPWPGVVQFLRRQPAASSILDIGCGNGKYLGIRPDCNMWGCDMCEPLAQIAAAKNPHAIITTANATNLPYPDESMDAAISIAVLHHLQEGREAFVQELHRVLKPGAPAYITVWAAEAITDKWTPMETHGDYMVPWNNGQIHMRYYHIFSPDELAALLSPYFTMDIQTECKNLHIELKKLKII